ncbi:MAG: nitroreductase family protein [Bacteroides sp.]|nr:nitroreductase family protein [Bacteroides sp.]
MTLLELIRKRRSVRNYEDRPVEKEKIEYVLECARLAPSAVNYQPWHFIIITQEEVKKELIKCYPREWFKKAPLYIVACMDINQSWKRAGDGKEHGDIDIAIAVEHICLAVTEQGLGTCWVCNFDPVLCKEILGLAKQTEPVVILPVGYPDSTEPVPSKRKTIKETCTIIE